MCGPDGIDIVDTESLVINVPNNSDNMNCDIITNAKHKVVLEDQVYKDKGTLKAVMTQYAIDHRFQWKTNRSSQTCIPIRPLPDQNDWNVPGYIKDQIVQPPNHKKLPGRPSKKYRDKT
uniref:Uncharacterized protein n=1 Tax=Solanum lycopersicum TaxID=4081 RepID=A0A3Q7G5E0_SOLLC